MKRLVYIIVSIISTLFFNACGGGETTSTTSTISNANIQTPNTTTAKINKDYNLHGKWIYINSGEPFYIYSNSALIYETLDNNLIKVLQDNNSYRYAMRAGTSNATALGNVKALSKVQGRAQARASNNIGGINVILENLRDANTRSTVQTDINGNFVSGALPVGDYKITIEDIQQNITIVDEKEELGTYNLVGDVVNNFRVGLVLENNFVYGDNREYKGKIVVENVSNATSIGVSYDIKLQDPSLQYFRKEIVLGSILAKAKKEIPIVFRFNGISENMRNIPLLVTIKDINGLTWTETLHIEVYKEKFYVNIRSNSANVKGYVILPFSDKVIKIDTKDSTIILPKVAKDYKILLSNPTINEESIYSIGVQRGAAFTTNFNDPSNSEPNNNLSNAKTINSGESVESYMHLGDLDYWVIHVKDDYKTVNTTSYTSIKSNGVYNDNGTYYYLNLTQDSYLNISLNDIKYYDISRRYLGYINKDTNQLLQSGEYLLEPYYNGDNFKISSFGIDDSKLFPQISTNGTYSDNGSYYYLDIREPSYVSVSGDHMKYYTMNLMYLSYIVADTTELLEVGEYLVKPYYKGGSFSIDSPYFSKVK